MNLSFLFPMVCFALLLPGPAPTPSPIAPPTLSAGRQKLRQVYTAELGVRERTGRNDGPRVRAYLAATGLPEGYAWCAAFISWAFAEAGHAGPRTAWSPALFPRARVVWERGKPVPGRKAGPQTGDVFGIYFPALERIAHAGFVDDWGEKYVITVEGNTNGDGGREGDGVYRKRRPIRSIYRVADWIGNPNKVRHD